MTHSIVLSQILSPDYVLVDVDCPNKKRAFEAVAQLFENGKGLPRAKVYEALFEREKLGSTGLGQAVAIPHGRIKGIKDTLCAIIKFKDAIPFESPDGIAVQMMVVLLVPENAGQKHLDVLAFFAQLLSDDAVREALLSAPTAQALFDIASAV